MQIMYLSMLKKQNLITLFEKQLIGTEKFKIWKLGVQPSDPMQDLRMARLNVVRKILGSCNDAGF